jgi:hypothetical protein
MATAIYMRVSSTKGQDTRSQEPDLTMWAKAQADQHRVVPLAPLQHLAQPGVDVGQGGPQLLVPGRGGHRYFAYEVGSPYRRGITMTVPVCRMQTN